MKRFSRAWLPALALLCALSACETTDELAPPVSQVAAVHSSSRAVPQERLLAGRALYLTRCTECHSVQSVRKYSAERWPAIVSVMSKRANLSDDERSQLLAYLLSVKESSPR